ncbi:hypothetical protein CEXT_218771 [Caerostris extrusa]|uniref:Uncharacterized protein n=1 Tax=Caerostris extrusa TaxID=172846 RepID=A0AAV4XBU6_CAEEX|nr:hypothetical protein CEXT_218771 [Caerostris extrusa]
MCTEKRRHSSQISHALTPIDRNQSPASLAVEVGCVMMIRGNGGSITGDQAGVEAGPVWSHRQRNQTSDSARHFQNSRLQEGSFPAE